VPSASPAGDDFGRAQPPRGPETILVVEDDDEVRAVMQEILQDAGYTVLAARSGDDALVLLASHTGAIHLLLTDVILPGLSGEMLANRIKERRPHMKVLFMSGYTDEIVRARVSTESPLLEKPFTSEELVTKVRDVLDTPRIE
jgi:two-component system, cell cycle sensor histidine kinase and response regulator CckA